MPRIAKADVTKALTLAAKTIVQAGGSDGRTSRAEMKAKLTELPKEQRALADIFFKFVDNRDFKKGAQVTAKDVDRAVAYAKQHMVAKYDLNQNGLSKDEIAKMSLTGKRAVDLAKALKAAGGNDALPGAKLATELNKYAKDTLFMSESDYAAQPFAVAFPAGHDLTPHNAITALKTEFDAFFKDSQYDNGITAEAYSAKDAKDFLKGLTEAQDSDPMYVKSAASFGAMVKLVNENLTDVKVFNVGPADAQGKLESDHGLYARLVMGRTADGKVAGFFVGSVET